MQENLNQAAHNFDFLSCICNQFKDNFFDWKVTIHFYIANHLLHALAKKRGKPLGKSHEEVKQSLQPKANPRLFPFKDDQWHNYNDLLNYSRTARYDGFIEKREAFEEIQKANYKHCKQLLEAFTIYIKNQGIIIPVYIKQDEMFSNTNDQVAKAK